jgi:hypothetical protein
VPRSLASQRVKIPPVLFTRNLLKNKALPKKQCFLVKVFAKFLRSKKVLSGNLTPCNGATPKESRIREIRTYGSMRGRRQ